MLFLGILRTYAWVKGFCGNSSNSYCDSVLNDDFVNFGVALEVEVLVF